MAGDLHFIVYFSEYTVDISLYCDKLKQVKRINGDSAETGGVSLFLKNGVSYAFNSPQNKLSDYLTIL